MLSVLRRIMPFYAVARGKVPGIYKTWPECESQVKGFASARYKKFASENEARDFIAENQNGASTSKPPAKRKAPVSVEGIKGPPKKIKLIDVPKPELEVVKLEQFGKYSFPVDSEGFVHVYTDGSCEGNGKNIACAGLGVFFVDGHALNTALPVKGRATNNCGEIQAATVAIKLARENGVKKLQINTDSKYLINSVTDWMPRWKAKGWKSTSNQALKNLSDFRELDEQLVGDLDIKWHHVRGHQGIAGNEKADRLAREGSEMYRKGQRS